MTLSFFSWSKFGDIRSRQKYGKRSRELCYISIHGLEKLKPVSVTSNFRFFFFMIFVTHTWFGKQEFTYVFDESGFDLLEAVVVWDYQFRNY